MCSLSTTPISSNGVSGPAPTTACWCRTCCGLMSDKAQALSERVDVLSRRSIREKLLCYFRQLADQGRGGDLYAAVFSQHAGGLHRHRPQRHDAGGSKRLREEGVVPVGRTAVYPVRRLRKSGFTKLLKSTLKIWQSDGENALTGIPGRVKISTMCHAEGYRSDRKQSFDHSGKKEQYVSYREKRGAPAHSHSV